MKTAAFIFIATFLTLGLLTFLYVEHVNQNVSLKLKDSELKALRESNAEKDRRLKERGDSLQIAFEMLQYREDTIAQADRVTKETIKDHEKIVFIRPASDSVRHRKLSDLFPSYVIPR